MSHCGTWFHTWGGMRAGGWRTQGSGEPLAPLRLQAGRWGCVSSAPFVCCKALEPILGTRKHPSLRAEPLRKHPPSPGGTGQGSHRLLPVPQLCQWAQPIPALPSQLQNPTASPAPGREHQGGRAGLRPCPPHSPVSDPARVAMGAPAVDVVAGVPVLAGGTELLAALSVEARRAGLVALGAVPASLAGQAAPVRHRARLQALALPTPATAEEGPVTQCSNPKTSCRHPVLSPQCQIRPNRLRALTVSCSLVRRSQPGTARGNTFPGSPARTCRSHPPGCTCPCSTGSTGHSGARTSAPGTGSAP